VVHTFSWLTAKKTKLRFKGRWAWIKSVEKLGPHRLRIIAKRPTAFDIARLGYQSDIFPEHIHGRMKVQSDFARKPVGTGMVKVTDVGQNRGITWVKNRNYVHESPAKPSSNIGRVKLLPIPDSGSQIARLLVGEVDVVRGLQMNQIDDLTKDGRFERHVEQGLSYIYLALDAKGRAGQKALTDARVRKALMLAVDRQTLTRMVIGDAKIPLVEALCWRLQSGCDYTKKPPARDPAAARKLLAAAGYAKGFDVEITTFSSPYMKQVAVALTDQFRRLGVRATVAAMPISAYRRKHRQGKIQILVGGWPAGAMADVSSTLGFFYRKGSRDFHGDKELQTLARKANSVMDEGKRRAIGRKIFDATTERAYFMPLSPSPGIFVHSKKVDISGSVFFSYGIAMGNINWK
jgi:peptide/nickel transport system substrate-binding protein